MRAQEAQRMDGMGLDIHGEKTRGHLGGSYSRLHYTARYLALIFCSMPEFLDDENEVSAVGFYMHPFIDGKRMNVSKLQQFIYAVQISGIEFPNLLLHSDCEGSYTKRGKLDLNGSLMTGNSIALMKELEKLVNEKEFQTDQYAEQMKYTKAFYELVKKEVEEGNGKITFG
jgi:hypothetical protein